MGRAISRTATDATSATRRAIVDVLVGYLASVCCFVSLTASVADSTLVLIPVDVVAETAGSDVLVVRSCRRSSGLSISHLLVEVDANGEMLSVAAKEAAGAANKISEQDAAAATESRERRYIIIRSSWFMVPAMVPFMDHGVGCVSTDRRRICTMAYPQLHMY